MKLRKLGDIIDMLLPLHPELSAVRSKLDDVDSATAIEQEKALRKIAEWIAPGGNIPGSGIRFSHGRDANDILKRMIRPLAAIASSTTSSQIVSAFSQVSLLLSVYLNAAVAKDPQAGGQALRIAGKISKVLHTLLVALRTLYGRGGGNIGLTFRLRDAVKEKNLAKVRRLLDQLGQALTTSFFTKMSISTSESEQLMVIASSVHEILAATELDEVLIAERSIVRSLDRIRSLLESAPSGPIQLVFHYADEMAASLGLRRSETPDGKSVEYASNTIKLIIRPSLALDARNPGGISWQLYIGKSIKHGVEPWPKHYNTSSIQQIVANIFANLSDVRARPSPSKSPLKVTSTQRKAAIAVLALLATSALVYALRKQIARYSKVTYAKFRLLLDDWRRSGWIPGKQLSRAQRVELVAFLQGLSPKELRSLLYATKKITPLRAQ